jgi:hypothetical protein
MITSSFLSRSLFEFNQYSLHKNGKLTYFSEMSMGWSQT